jgi:CBS domain-containing protein
MIKYVMIENPVTANPNTSLKEIVNMLWKKHIGSIVITDAENKCQGIFTERDLIRIVAQETSLETPVKEVMTTNVVTIGEEASIEEARGLIISHNVRHLPVTNSKGELTGLFSIRNFLDAFFGLRSSKYC